MLSALLFLGCRDYVDHVPVVHDTAGADTAGDTAEDTAEDTAQDTATTTELGFTTDAVFTETLVVVPASPYWDEITDPSNTVCAFAPGASGYSSACAPPADTLAAGSMWTTGLSGNFVAFAFGDADSSGTWETGEVLVAMSRYQLVFIEGEPSAELAALGVAAGWNALNLHAYDTTGELSPADPLAIPLTRNLEAALTVSLGGPVDVVYDADTRLGVLFSGDAGDVLLDQGAVTEPWLVALDGQPVDGWTREVVPGVRRGEGWVAAYQDANASGAWDAEESFVATPKDGDGNGIDIAWLTPPADDPSLAMRFMLTLGVEQFGWALWNMNGGAAPEDATAITLSAM